MQTPSRRTRSYALIYLDRTEEDLIAWNAVLRYSGHQSPQDELLLLSDYYPLGTAAACALATWTDRQLTAWLKTLRFWTGDVIIERD